jgi:hypothetical protein
MTDDMQKRFNEAVDSLSFEGENQFDIDQDIYSRGYDDGDYNATLTLKGFVKDDTAIVREYWADDIGRPHLSPPAKAREDFFSLKLSAVDDYVSERREGVESDVMERFMDLKGRFRDDVGKEEIDREYDDEDMELSRDKGGFGRER